MIVEAMSPSRLNTHRDCEARYYFHYHEGLNSPPSMAMVRGTVIDEASNNTLTGVIEGHLTSREDIVEQTVHDWDARSDEIEWDFARDGKPSLVRESIPKGTRLAYDDLWMELEPKEVQPRIRYDIEDEGFVLPIQGYADVIESNGTIRDLKTASRKWNRGREFNETQAKVYVGQTFHELKDVNKAPFVYDILVMTPAGRKVYLDQRELTVTREQVEFVWREMIIRAKRVLHTMDMLEHGSPRDAIIPNRESFLCSQRHCGFWELCVTEFGGTVRE